MKVVPETCPAH